MIICKGCGKPIVYAKNFETGHTIPLDPNPPVYYVEYSDGDEHDAPVIATRAKEYMVSHFATCPKANDFSGKNKNENL